MLIHVLFGRSILNMSLLCSVDLYLLQHSMLLFVVAEDSPAVLRSYRLVQSGSYLLALSLNLLFLLLSVPGSVCVCVCVYQVGVTPQCQTHHAFHHITITLIQKNVDGHCRRQMSDRERSDLDFYSPSLPGQVDDVINGCSTPKFPPYLITLLPLFPLPWD